MVAGNPCYGSDGIPLLPSSTTSNSYPRARQGEVPPTPPTPAGENIRISVGGCYVVESIPSVTPDAPGSPRVSTARPPTVDDSVPPPAASPSDLIRSIVDNCYDGTPIALAPSNKGAYPRQRQGEPAPPAATPAGQAIRQIVDQCYGPISPPLTPSTGKPIRNRQGEPPAVATINPGQVIRDIVQRCYPAVDLAPVQEAIGPSGIDVIKLDPVGPIDWLCELFPDLTICQFGDVGPISMPPTMPDPGDLNDDCEEVMNGLADGSVKKSTDPQQAKEGIYIVLESGRELVCKGLNEDGDPGWEQCVKDAVDCIFKPYVTGTWRTPGADCKSFYFRGENATTGEICIENCNGPRIGIYEYAKGNAQPNVSIAPFSNAVGGSSAALKHNLRVVTTDVAGNYKGGKVLSESGTLYFNSTTTQTRTVTMGSATITFKARGVANGNEYDSEWWVESWTGTLPAIGTTATHTWNPGLRDLTVTLEIIGGGAEDSRYGLTPAPDKPGYVSVGSDPAFYILGQQLDGTVPLYRFYSPSTEDTFLVTNPGVPDSEGSGERATMNAAGMMNGEILGYVYKTPSDAVAALAQGEQVEELHRYYRGGSPAITASFQGTDLVIGGSGTGSVKLDMKWSDNPSTAGTAFDTLTVAGATFTRSGRKGSSSTMVNVVAGQSYAVSGINYSSTVKDGGEFLCLRDGDGSDCNATLRIGTLTEVTPGPSPDHKYSLVKAQQTDKPATYLPNRLSYRIMNRPAAPVIVSYNIIAGNAGYDSSWGVAITNAAGDSISWARVIKGRVKQNVDTTQYKIPISVLEQYPNQEIVFFLVPNGGNNGLTDGQTITFTANSGGYKNSASSQSDWVFFSNRKMNPDDVSKVRFNSENWQWWEDLLNGDDDYDDFKVYYEMMQPGSDYKYEGIEAYVFGEDMPDPVKIPVIVKEKCTDPQFDNCFEETTVTRTGCGSPVPQSSATGQENASVGVCSGEYTAEVNRTQTITALKAGTLELKAYGIMIRAPEAEEIKYRFTFKKNGSTIVDYTANVATWPRIGHTFGQFTVAEGDTLTYKLEEISKGPAAGSCSFGLIMMDVASQQFEKPWSTNLVTSPAAGEAAGRSRIASNSPRTDTDTGNQGRIKKLSIQLWDNRAQSWTDKVVVWDNGQQVADNTYWNDNYYGGSEWGQQMGDNSRNAYPGFYEGGTNGRRGIIMSSNHDADGSYTRSSTTGDRGIYYNTLFEFNRGLICKPSETIEGNTGLKVDSNFFQHSNKNGFTAWFGHYKAPGASGSDKQAFHNLLDAYYASGITNGNAGGYPMGTVPTSNGQYSKMSFMHDYVLGEFGAQERIVDTIPNGKVRMAFWPYTVPPTDFVDGVDLRYGNSIYWCAGVEVFGVTEGDAYQINQEFEFEYPPIQAQKNKYQNVAGSVTPYYPRDNGTNVSLPREIILEAEDRESDPERFTPREVFYQESHNRDSNLWYLCQSDQKVDRIKFKLTIDEVY